MLKKINRKSLNKLYDKIDGFILLTEFMTERLPIGNKPYRVVEGIFNPNVINQKIFQSIKLFFMVVHLLVGMV